MVKGGANTATRGFTLVELLITVAIIGVLAGVAIPIFTDYLDTASEGVMRSNIETIRAFEEDFRMTEGAYVSATYDPANPDAAGGLKKLLGWEPKTSEDQITYVVDNVTSKSFRITATAADGKSVVVDYP